MLLAVAAFATMFSIANTEPSAAVVTSLVFIIIGVLAPSPS